MFAGRLFFVYEHRNDGSNVHLSTEYSWDACAPERTE
jgi:hypothetical protein